ncbi:MAG: MarR family winged helix-turn-helix transcriptional regulator [Pyrinomonadaceae bacterium]
MSEPIIFEETVSYLLAKVATAFRNSMETHMAEVDLHSGQVFVMIELWRKDGMKQIELAELLNVKAPTVSNMIRGLEKINLVKTKKDAKDGRAMTVHLTARGRTMKEEVEKRWIDVETECVAGLSASDRFVLFEVLKKLRGTYTGRKVVEDE